MASSTDSTIKSAGWYLMMFAAVGVSAYALALGFAPAVRGSFVANMVLQTPGAALLHFFGGGIVLLAGASQFHQGFRTKHRPASTLDDPKLCVDPGRGNFAYLFTPVYDAGYAL